MNKGSKRKNDTIQNSSSKKSNIDDPHDFSSPLSSTLLEEDNKTSDTVITVDRDTVHENDDENNSFVDKLLSTIDFLNTLLKTKEDTIKECVTEKDFLVTKVNNMEKLLTEKDSYIKNMEKNIEKMSEIQSKVVSVAKSDKKVAKEKEEKEMEQSSVEAASDESKRKTRRNNVKEKKNKCRFEDQGQCKKRKECPLYHPLKICLPHSKVGYCPRRDSCNFRHPLKPCFQWQREGKCFFGDKCFFRHPAELIKKPFLEESPNQNLKPPIIMSMFNPLTNIPTTFPVNMTPSPWMNNPWQMQHQKN